MHRVESSRLPGGNVREIVKEAAETRTPPRDEEQEEEKVYVALDKDVKEGKSNLDWVLQNTSKEKKIVILHVHRPAQKIPMMGAWFPANQLKQEEVAAYRRLEREQVEECLNDYVNTIKLVKLRVPEKIVVETDDVGKGLVLLVAKHKITKLVMGAASDKHYSRKMKAPRSKAALTVQQQADSTCKIWFVCKGKLICTRDACHDASDVVQPSISSQSTSPSLRSRSVTAGSTSNIDEGHANEFLNYRSKSVGAILPLELTLASSPGEGLVGTPRSVSRESSVVDDALDHREYSEMFNTMSLLPIMINADNVEDSPDLSPLYFPEEDYQFSSLQHELQDDDAIHHKLQDSLIEANNLKREAYHEFSRRKKAEQDLVEALRKVKLAENLCAKVAKYRKDLEVKLAKENIEKKELKLQHEVIYEELQKAREREVLLERKISDSDHAVQDLKEKLEEALYFIETLKRDYEVLCQEHETTVRENERLHGSKGQETISSSSSSRILPFSEFSFLELEKATNNFHDTFNIGEGGYGTVYKGLMGKTTVAIKRLNPEGMQGKSEFQQEIEVLSRVRHPNLVTLIGACPEAWALIYEYLPNGSLEDRLACKDNTKPLNWRDRVRIASEICSALIFLHSCKPCSIVHGDLKPANILLDGKLVSKLGDFGISRLLIPSLQTTSIIYHTHQPKGTFAYMDPELFSSGEITARSDVYSFGVVLLRLLTGKPAIGLSKLVQEALDNNCLNCIIDASAGHWPYMQAEQLAKLGLQCCEVSRKNRPQATEVWTVLQPLARTAVSVTHSSSLRPGLDDNG